MNKPTATFRQETTVSVPEILEKLAATPTDIIAALWPQFDTADVQAALQQAATLTRQQDEPVGEPPLVPESSTELDLQKVMVVDDSEDNLLLMHHMFKRTDFTLRTTANPEEALAIAKVERPVLIVSDVQMPVMTGFDLLSALKDDEQTKNIAVILVTAHHRTSNHASQGLIMGADDYIQRPFMRNEFLSRVEAVVRLKRAEIETRRQAQDIAQRNEQLKWVNDLALAVNSSLELSEIFAFSMQKLSQILEVEAVSIVLLYYERRKFVINISSRRGKSISIPQKIETWPARDSLRTWLSPIISDTVNRYAAELGLEALPTRHNVEVFPMSSREQLVGAIAIIDKHGGQFDDSDLVLLNSAAGIIAVAVENARLLEQAQQQVDDLIALAEIGRALTSNLDLAQVLKQTTLFVQRSLQCEAVSIWLLDRAKNELVLRTASGVGAEAITGFHLPIDQGVVGYVARTGESYISADLSKDDKHFANIPITDKYRPHSILSVPVQSKGEIIGVMQALHQQTNWFDPEHLRLSYPVANFVGIAVENARLFQEVQDFSRHLEQMVAARTRELAEEKEKTEAILANMADGLIVLDAETCVLTANKAAERMLSFDLNEQQGKPVAPEKLQDPLWRSIHNIIESDRATVTATVDVTAPQTGALLSVQTHSAKVQNEAGQMIGTVIVLRDITALKDVERMKSRFMAGVTHELKTPLSVIRLHAKNLLAYDDRLPAAKRVTLLNSIQSQAQLLSSLIEDILELSRFDAGITKTKHEVINLGPLIDQLIVDLRPLAESKQVTLRWQYPRSPVTVLADAGQIERLARNLIDNAIKYTRSGGQVEIDTYHELRKDKAFGIIRVADTGIGIPPEQLTDIFTRFHRVDPSHTIPGTGLGLSIVKEIVNAHNGDIQLDSRLGEGSTFTVRLPAPTY